MQPTGRARRARRQQLGALGRAARQALPATRIERAARRNCVQARHAAIDLHQPVAMALQRRDRSHQPRRIWMARLVDHVRHRADLGYAARIHHRHAVSGFRNHAHVVRDQHHRRAVFAAQAFEQFDDLRLDGHVQRGGGLVGHHQFGFGRQGQRDHHPLTHAARKLVRIVVDAFTRRRNAGGRQQFDRAVARLRPRHVQVRDDGFRQLPAHRVQRIQRGQRVLEHRADLAAAHAAHLLVGQVVDAAARQQDLACGNAPGRLQQADDGRAGQRFAGTRFPHHAQDFARLDGKGHIVQGA
ncbi:hypothetical protein G6F68_010119 [Rhizopus microsporus]|nr:hypothetical protein G6F68_010119 [Rhizopus microsporus]